MSLESDDLEGLLAVSGELLAVLDGTGRVLRLGGPWQQVLGDGAGELSTEGLLARVHPEDRALLTDWFAELGERPATAAGTIPPADLEVRLRQDAGTHRLLAVRLGGHVGGGVGGDVGGDVGRDAAGSSGGQRPQARVYLAARDITEQRRLRTTTQLLEQVGEVGSWELDVDSGGQGVWSAVTHRLHGTDPQRFVPTAEAALGFYPPAARARVAAAVERVVAEGAGFDLEVPFRPRDGDERLVRITGQALLRAGRVVRVVGTLEDVTQRRAALRDLERLARLTELSTEGVVEADAHGRITYANAQLGVLLGEDPGALLGRSVLPVVCGVDAACSLSDLERGVCGDYPDRRTVELARAGGRFRAQVSLRALTEDGKLLGYAAVISDVEAQTRAREQLEATTARLVRAQRLAGLGHWQQVDAAGTVQGCAQLSALVGFDLTGGVEQARFRAAVHAEDRAGLCEREARLEVGETLDSIHRLVHADGTEHMVHEVVARRVDERGADRLEGTVHDVTAVYATEQALRASEAQLRRVLTATNDGWWEADFTTNRVMYSPRWYEIHGRDPAEVVDPWQIWHGVVHPEDLPRMEEAIIGAQARGDADFEVALRVRHGDGHDLPVLIRGRFEYDETGQPVRLSGTTTDRSEALRAEIAKDRFVSTVSHELRTPLTAITGAIELLASRRQQQDDGQTDQLLALAGRNTWRLRGLIDDLLDVERLRRGGLVLARSPVRLAELVTSVVDEQTAVARAAGVELECRLADPGLVLELDARRIVQAVAKLVLNALRFAPRGSRVVVSVLPVAQGEVRTEVLDQGPGIPEEVGEDVFEWFVQADPSDTRTHGGTGLGLAICRDVVSAHGGRIGYERRDGTTCLWFTLPA